MWLAAVLHKKEGGGGQQDVRLVREEQGSRLGSSESGGRVKEGIGRGGKRGRVLGRSWRTARAPSIDTAA